MAIDQGKCVGTTRTTWDKKADLEFDYSKYLPHTSQTELTKLVILSSYRHTHLLMHLYMATFDFHKKNFSVQPYENIVFSATPKMLGYYKVIGHQLFANEVFVHSILKTKSYLMGCSREHFETVCEEFKKIIDGNAFIKAKWGLKYWWYKMITK